jgi:hypothetical protein
MYKIITKEQLKTFEYCISCGSKNKISYLEIGPYARGEDYFEPKWHKVKFNDISNIIFDELKLKCSNGNCLTGHIFASQPKYYPKDYRLSMQTIHGNKKSIESDLSFLEKIETNCLIDMEKLKSIVNLYKTFQ